VPAQLACDISPGIKRQSSTTRSFTRCTDIGYAIVRQLEQELTTRGVA